MSTSFGALCTDFYVNQKIATRMDLPTERETVLHLLDRVRASQPSMTRFRKYPDELSLESGRQEGAYRWLSMHPNAIRTGHVNPETLDEAYSLHRLMLEIAPYHLTISPLDIEYIDLLFGFDLEAKANQHKIVYDALFADSPFANLMAGPETQPVDVQPIFGVNLNEQSDLQAFFEVKTSTTASQVRNDQYRVEPISVYMTIRRLGSVSKIEQLPEIFETMRQHAERLATDQLVPTLVNPIRSEITSTT
jgi:hypothetical protein